MWNYIKKIWAKITAKFKIAIFTILGVGIALASPPDLTIDQKIEAEFSEMGIGIKQISEYCKDEICYMQHEYETPRGERGITKYATWEEDYKTYRTAITTGIENDRSELKKLIKDNTPILATSTE